MSAGVFEIADFGIVAGGEDGFAAAVKEAVPLFEAARGYRSLRLRRSIEVPSHFQLIVHWDSVEAHMVGFRESPAFVEWRALVGGYFAAPPEVEHHATIIETGSA